MNKEVYKEMCSKIYEGEDWDRMINCLERKDKEIERLNKRIEDLNIINEEHQILNEMIRKELQQKENIIKEAIEYIEQCQLGEDIEGRPYMLGNQKEGQELLRILDKVDKENI